MKKIISLLVLSLSMQSAPSFATAQTASKVQKEVAALIEHAQFYNLSAEQTLLLAQQAIDQAAHVDDFGVEVPQDNHKKMMIIAGVVVAVVVIGGIAYYYFSEKKINTAWYIAEEMAKKLADGGSLEEVRLWAKMQSKNLNDAEIVYLYKTDVELDEELSWRIKERLIDPLSKHRINNYAKFNILRILESVSKLPVTKVEIAEARREFAK